MKLLEHIWQQSQGVEHQFTHKAILFIGSESYDAPTITVLQGLNQLGFTVYVLHKPNINSWFCNHIVDSVDKIQFDFVLSNLHWGTRWQFYHEYKLMEFPKALIDGDDNRNWVTWRDKYADYTRIYVVNPPNDIMNQKLMPYRWVESLTGYFPDIIFTAQKQFNETESLYLPFGIHHEYKLYAQNKTTSQRTVDFVHIPGPGKKRHNTMYLIRILETLRILPGKIHNGTAYGDSVAPESITSQINCDNNVHSYHRWRIGRRYFEILNDSKVCIYPGIDTLPFWDSQRPWEAYASGCLVMLSRPSIDVGAYPITELCDFAVYDNPSQLISKCRYLYRQPEFLDKLRKDTIEQANKYFSPRPIARYFLRHMAQRFELS